MCRGSLKDESGLCSCLLQVSISLKFFKDLQQYGADKVGHKEMCVHTCSYSCKHPEPTTVYVHMYIICILVASNVRIYLCKYVWNLYIHMYTHFYICTYIYVYMLAQR